ncbi:hypothetical protein [Microbacterium profundi]|uniref:hypothetical protein n=1 Tax=Microbacterium profundi TaxID=450380 RepID=UPI00051A2074|nr:hypothetical protein [Microbacterium profundi]
MVGVAAGAAGTKISATLKPDDNAVAELIGEPRSSTREALETLLDADRAAIDARLAYTTPRTLRIEAGVEGVDGTGQVDDSGAIQRILDSASRGSTIVFGLPGSSRHFRIDKTLVINTGQLRVIGTGADHYSASLHTAAPITMLQVRESGLILDQVAFSSSPERGAEQATGVEFLGSDAADIDGHVLRCAFFKLLRGVVMRGKNLRIENSLFSSGRTGIHVGGADKTFHQKFESRNLIAHANRFHAMGVKPDDADVMISNEHQHSASQINNNFFDYSWGGNQIAIHGAASAEHSAINMVGNSHHQMAGAAYSLDRVSTCKVSSAQVVGDTASEGVAVSLTNSNAVSLVDVSVSNHHVGFQVSDAVHIALRGVTASQNRSDGLILGRGLNRLTLDGVSAFGNDGWGITGVPPTNAYRGLVSSYLNQRGDLSPDLGL